MTEEQKAIFCDKFCKYPSIYDEEVAGVPLSESKICRQCPLNEDQKETTQGQQATEETTKRFQITNHIRLIELFAGIGSQAMALRDMGADFESWVTCEWWTQPNASYKAIHCEHDTTDYSEELTREAVIDYLFKKGISADGKKPMTRDQIAKKPEKWQRDTYNNIFATKNLVNIQQVHGEDLKIIDPEENTYILTYSFQCQDLSVAGKMRGMDKGSNTRSSMLWEVERLLSECEVLPQVLLMENVPQVMGKKNKANFEIWQEYLTSRGYRNFAQIINAADHGVAQKRNRAYMVSILGDFDYQFPKPYDLEKCMDDYLEEEVEEKFYYTSEQTEALIAERKLEKLQDKTLSNTIRGGV